MIRSAMVSLVFLLTLSTFASSREILVGGSVSGVAADYRYSPSAASNGDGFFAVWDDDRSGAGSGFGIGSVIGTRVTREGRILDPLGLRIATTAGTVHEPRVVWDGEAYLVVWLASTHPDLERRFYAARIAPDGTFVMAPRVVASGGTVDDGRYVASNGTVSVITYRTYTNQIGVTVLDRNGEPLHEEIVSGAAEYKYEPVIAAGTSRFVIAWNGNQGFSHADDEIKAVTLSADGHVIGNPVTAGPGGHPAIGTDGTRFTIAATENVQWQEYILRSRTFDSSLNPVGEAHVLLTERQLRHVSVLWVGDRYEVIALRTHQPGENEIVSVGLDRDGNPQSIRGRGSVRGEILWSTFAAATNGVDVLLARLSDSAPGYRQVYGQLYPANRTASDAPMLLSWSGNAHHQPRIASSPSGHIIAWTEESGAYATRVDRDGNSLDGRGIALSGTDSGYGSFPRTRVAFDGTNYVVAWTDVNFIGVRYIAPLTGTTVAETRVEVPGWSSFALAASPEATYVVYDNLGLRVTRIPHATHTPDPMPLALLTEDMRVGHPEAAWNGSELLVTWTEEHVLDNVSPPLSLSIAIYAARVTAENWLLGPTLVIAAPSTVTVDGYEYYETYGPLSVASNGADWLVVSNFRGDEVIARRVLRNGTLEGAAPVKIGTGADPVVAWDRSRYAVAWKEGTAFDVARPIVLSAVPASGELIATQRAVVTSAAAPSRPSLAPAPSGGMAVVYTKVSFLPQHAGVERTFLRFMDSTTPRGRAIRR